jgi:hypothetical protein
MSAADSHTSLYKGFNPFHTASHSNSIASPTVHYFFTRFFCFGLYMIETDIPHLSESNTCFNITFVWNGKLYFSIETCHVLVNLFPCSKCKTFSTGFSEMSIWLCRSTPRILFSDRFNACSISLLCEKYSYPMHIQWNHNIQLTVKVCDIRGASRK